MANAKFTNPTLKPVLAYVGATDLAVEKVRDAVADVQKRVAGVQKTDAKKIRAAVEARVAELQGEAKAYPAKVQSLVDENVTAATAAYTELVERGESLVGRIRRQPSTKATVKSAETTVAKAKTTVTQAKKATAKKSTAKKAPARKAPTKKTAAAQSSAKATATAAQNTAANAAKAVTDAVEKIGD